MNATFFSSGREKAWRAQRNPEGRGALDNADQKLREIGRKRTGVER